MACESGKGSGFAFLAGAALGAAAGLLLAPKKGSELRKDLAIKADEAYDKVVSYDYAAQKEKIAERVGELKTQATQKAEEFKGKVAETKDKAKNLISKNDDKDLFEEL